MTKSTRIKVFIGSILLFILLLLFAKYLRVPFLNIRLEDAIPQQTAFLISFKKDQLSQGYEHEVFSTLIPNALETDLTNFEEFLRGRIKISEKQRFLVAVQPSRSSGADLLFITDGARRLDIEKILASRKDIQTRKYLFRNHEVFIAKSKGFEFSIARYRNILLFGRQAYLLESAISQLKNPSVSLFRDEHFTGVHQHHFNGGDSWQFYINLQELSAQYSPLIDPAKLAVVASLGQVGSWIKLQFPLDRKYAEWEGALSAAPSHKLLEANRRSMGAGFKSSFNSLPDNIASAIWLTLGDYTPSNYEDVWRKYFKSWFGGEMTFAVGEPLENDAYERFLLLKTKNTQKAEMALLDFSNKKGSQSSFDYQMFKIHKLTGIDISAMFGAEEWLSSPYAVALEDYVLFANSKSGMERWLDKYMAGQTFSKSVEILKMLRPLPLEANGFMYVDSGNSWQQLSQLLEDGFEASLRGNPMLFEKLALTWSRTGSILKFKAVTSDGAQLPGQSANILWRTPLAAPAAIAPVIIINPLSKETSIFIQDESHQIYRIAKSGRILWRRKLEEPILSDVVQLDLHNNREIQLVFSTASRIYIIDENGADLEDYPLELQTAATNGVTVVDFFKSHDYRFFIACENGKAYGFDEKGTPVEGWRPHDSIGIVRLPMVHFQASSMDFLVMIDEIGKLQVYQKNGEFRFPPKPIGLGINQRPYFQSARNSSRIVACDSRGKVVVTNFSGESFGLSLPVGDNTDVKFAFADVTGDNRKDYLALSGSSLAVFSYQGTAFKKVFEHKFNAAQDLLFPVELSAAKKSFIGVVNQSKGQIHMLDGDGRMLPQFPLAGTTSFRIVDLMGDGRAVLVTGNRESVYTYILD